METMLGGIFGGMLLFGLIMLGVGIAAFVFWLKMLIASIWHDYELSYHHLKGH